MAISVETGSSPTIADPMVPRVARVRRRRSEIPHTCTLELEAQPNDPGFAPGQFNMLYVMGVGEVPISMSGDPAKPGLVHTIRAAGAVSTALTELKRGDTLGVRGPFGREWPLAEASGKDVVVMAGGIGLAPLRPLLYRLFAAPGTYGRVSLLSGSRSPEDILYRRELERWRDRGRATVEMTVDHTTSKWRGHVGVVTSLLGPGLFDPGNTIAFLCGPEVMMRFSIATLRDLGLPAQSIYVSMERNMKCAVGHCGHCQFGSTFVCRDGPIFRYDRIRDIFGVREV
ncbi:MAG: FAD/NAD(P)-binding protein [Arenicellales bacterium]